MIDPITLTVVQNGLGNICSEMDLVHEKASFSPVISEAFDRSNGLYDAKTGAVIAQGDLGLPIFMGVMQATVAAVIARVKDPAPGDVFLVNDPYLGGTHLMDVKMVRPYFRDGRLWCWLANTGHWPDIGGMVPGGFSSRATEVHQEGLRIPPVRLLKAGEMQQDIVDMVLSNIRVPSERIGDMQAQLGALGVGKRRLDAFLTKMGEPVVRDAMAELADRSERQMRAHIEAIPDGTYESVAVVDSDGIVDRPLNIKLRLTIEGGTASFDFAGSSPPCKGPMNSVWATTHSSVLLAMKHVFPDVPINTGCFRPLVVARPEGTFLDAQYPKPVAGCAAEVSQRIAEAVFLCLAQAIPDKLFGMPAGTSGNLTLGGWDPRFDRAYVMYFFTGGGYGGWHGGDGISNGTSTIGISKTQPVEVLEQHYPILFERYALRDGSSGDGEYRGGLGLDYSIRLLAGEGTASFLMDHGRSGPPGAAGGETGGANRIKLTLRGQDFVPPQLSKGEGYELAPGDQIAVQTPGGGGYGPPEHRPASMRERDRRRGY
ncbi:hydantoinase B/oxoprolinase family protein [Acidisphaera sp. L21]|uniref:hydantoinase B/oxoprolinase family protein n=1 Tax=Acidisphaera sp. L21 TaxID=1641851 RepID=UPI00131D454A|nr:hydantoinase B/oxoprolinase family protein [Acidisphaera sp. L21]